ncbi:MAG TPA: hypothetical protein VI386_32890 [Candidatus Sulfotelmatobacter sp.]
MKNAKLIEEMRKDFTIEAWNEVGGSLAQTLEVIQADKRGKKALASLMKGGCNPGMLLRELLLYCGSDLGAFIQWDKKYAHAKTQLTTISTQLERYAVIIETIARDVMDDDYEPYGPAFHIPVSLRQSAQLLSSALTALKKQTHGKTGKNTRLVYLSYHIKAATNRPHYKEIASLIASLRRDTSCNIVQLADAIRRTIKRHEQQDPKFFAGEREDVVSIFSQWRSRIALANHPDTR